MSGGYIDRPAIQSSMLFSSIGTRKRIYALFVLLAFRDAWAALTAFDKDQLEEGIADITRNVMISTKYLEPDDGSCSSSAGPWCRSLHGSYRGAAPRGLFSLFGSLPGDAGFLLQDDIGTHFLSEGKNEDVASPNAATSSDPTITLSKGLQVDFGRFVLPHEARLPHQLTLTGNLTVDMHGSFAVVDDVIMGLEQRDRRDFSSRQHVEVQDSFAYMRFSSPVVIEGFFVAKDADDRGKNRKWLKADTGSPAPVVIRGRNGQSEVWSEYLQDEELHSGWVDATVKFESVTEIAILGGSGLRIKGAFISKAQREVDASDDQGEVEKSSPGWLLSTAAIVSSLDDVSIVPFEIPSAAALISLDEVHKHGRYRWRRDLFDDDVLPVADHEEDILDERQEFHDSRSTSGMLAMLRALSSGAFPFPPDISLKRLEADVELYGSLVDEVQLEEAVNAKSHDELLEGIFMLNKLDALDHLIMRFLWANRTGALLFPDDVGVADSSQPEREVEERKANDESLADQGHSVRARQVRLLEDLEKSTASCAEWVEPIRHNLAIINQAGPAEVTFIRGDSGKLFVVEYYNIDTGRTAEAETEISDPTAFFSELLGLESELLDDGEPLDDAYSEESYADSEESYADSEESYAYSEESYAYSEESYMEEFKEVLKELRQATSDGQTSDGQSDGQSGDGQILDEQMLDDEEEEEDKRSFPTYSDAQEVFQELVEDIQIRLPRQGNMHSLAIVVGVPCLLLFALLYPLYIAAAPDRVAGREPLLYSMASRALNTFSAAICAAFRAVLRILDSEREHA